MLRAKAVEEYLREAANLVIIKLALVGGGVQGNAETQWKPLCVPPISHPPCRHILQPEQGQFSLDTRLHIGFHVEPVKHCTRYHHYNLRAGSESMPHPGTQSWNSIGQGDQR